MSELHVQVVNIDEIFPHPNADRLELCRIAGWNCVVRKGEFLAGQKVVYLPIDSILPFDLETRLFPPDSKVKLSKSRVKTIKLRGAISQGIVITLEDALLPANTVTGTDVAALLGITKYEPAVKDTPLDMQVKKTRRNTNPSFHKYTDIQNFKYYPNLFEVGEYVYVSEKLHGSSARYGWFPTDTNTLWRKIKKFFHLLPTHEFCFGSRNVQLQNRHIYSGFYDVNIWSKVLEREDLKEKLGRGEAVYGEIVGAGIQKGYTYGYLPGHYGFYVYDVMVDGRWLNYDALKAFCEARHLQMVPELYVGPYDAELVSNLRVGNSTIGYQECREGIVIKSAVERNSLVGRAVLKHINDEYLLGDQTDFH